MRENGIRRIWRGGGAVANGWLGIPSAFSAETMAHQGWDSLTVDMQHGVVDYQAAVSMLTAMTPQPRSSNRATLWSRSSRWSLQRGQ